MEIESVIYGKLHNTFNISFHFIWEFVFNCVILPLNKLNTITHKNMNNILPEKYFGRDALPYWCIVALDCATLVLAGVISVYLTLGGEAVIADFWRYVNIWLFALPFFLLFMHLFRTYTGMLKNTKKAMFIQLASALVLGGLLLEGASFLLPNGLFPFRVPIRVIGVTVLISLIFQFVYRILARVIFNDRKEESAQAIFFNMFNNSKGVVDVSLGERTRINLCLAHMSEDEVEKKYVREAFDTNWVVPLGPNVNAFEKDLEDFVNDDGQNKSLDKKVVALSAGTAAVHLALLACDVQPGDEVIVQSFTFCASANPVTYLGAMPVFVDSEPDTWNMDPALLETAIQDRIRIKGKAPKAIVPVALYGMPYQIDRIMEVANRYNIPVVEDAAEGFGSTWKGRKLGTFGRYGVLSFNGNKMITTSGGGALITNNDADKNNVLWYATQAREAYPYYQHETIGFNYRMSNVCAGIGRGQMTIANDHINHHKHVQDLYEQLLAEVQGIKVHKQPNDAAFDSNYWLVTITLSPDLKIVGQDMAYKKKVQGAVGGAAGVVHTVDCPTTDCQPNDNVEALRTYLDTAQIEARPLWKPMHKQPVYKNAPAYINGVSESLFKVGMCLPAGPCVTDLDVHYIVRTIKSAIVTH